MYPTSRRPVWVSGFSFKLTIKTITAMKIKPHYMFITSLALASICAADTQLQKTMLTEPGEFSSVWLPTSSLMVGSLTESVGASLLTVHLPDATAATAYGFAAAGISKEKGSFCLGILLTDLKVALDANDNPRAAVAIDALVAGLAELKAPAPLVKAAVSMGAALNAGLGTATVRRASMPVIEPFIEAFVEQEGLLSFLRLGEWAEATRLALASAGDGKHGAVASLLGIQNPSAYFLAAAEKMGMPAGGVAALQTLQSMAGEQELSDSDLHGARIAIEQLLIAMQ